MLFHVFLLQWWQMSWSGVDLAGCPNYFCKDRGMYLFIFAETGHLTMWAPRRCRFSSQKVFAPLHCKFLDLPLLVVLLLIITISNPPLTNLPFTLCSSNLCFVCFPSSTILVSLSIPGINLPAQHFKNGNRNSSHKVLLLSPKRGNNVMNERGYITVGHF